MGATSRFVDRLAAARPIVAALSEAEAPESEWSPHRVCSKSPQEQKRRSRSGFRSVQSTFLEGWYLATSERHHRIAENSQRDEPSTFFDHRNSPWLLMTRPPGFDPLGFALSSWVFFVRAADCHPGLSADTSHLALAPGGRRASKVVAAI